MFKLCDQTYEIYFPNSLNKFIGYGPAPPVPLKWTQVLTRTDHNKVTTVYEDRTVTHDSNGVTHVYYRKPTMQFIMSLTDAKEQYVRFHDDGSVEHGIAGEYYRWGEDVFTILTDYYERCDCRDCLGDYDTDVDEEDEIVENLLNYGMCYNPYKAK